MTGLRVTFFVATVLSIWTAMHAYALQRVLSLPGLASGALRHWVIAGFAVLWVSYPFGRILDRRDLELPAYLFEIVGATWMGVLFLLITALFAADVATGFGWVLPRAAMPARMAAVSLAVVLALIAIPQGLRAPAVRRYDLAIAGLPRDADGLTLAQLSDVHLGSLLGERWLAARVAQVEALRPDLLVITGDLVDGDSGRVRALLPQLRRLRAPLGVWAVTGNHEFYAGLEASVQLLSDAGFTVLRDTAAEIRPGLVLAGVDDLTARRQFRLDGDPIARALGARPPGATILLSHTPWRADDAARAGVGLMLSGHTHDGQIWPFNHLARLQYEYVGGHYRVGAMHLVVSRGTGTWGPRMRLWRPSEIVVVTLRAV